MLLCPAVCGLGSLGFLRGTSEGAKAGSVSAGAFQAFLERVELGDLIADLPGDSPV